MSFSSIFFLKKFFKIFFVFFKGVLMIIKISDGLSNFKKEIKFKGCTVDELKFVFELSTRCGKTIILNLHN
jgi:hypothetical protein